ncbi:MAG: hypothetical protein N2038_09135 [Geminicoccaceae bacterium]|nr:hypothetical protein [Geminicoccaceae bacterium]
MQTVPRAECIPPIRHFGVQVAFAAAAALFASVAAAAGLGASGPTSAALAAVAGLFALFAAGRVVGTGAPPLPRVLLDGAVLALLAFAADPGAAPWATPRSWAELATLTPLGAAVAIALYLAAGFWTLAREQRPPRPLTACAWAVAPFSFNVLLLLGARPLLGELGGLLAPIDVGPVVAVGIGRFVVLAGFNLGLAVAIGLVMDRRWTRDPILLAVLVAAAAFATVTPLIAELGSSRAVAELPALPRLAALLATGSLAQAGLWGEVFLVTGVLLDALIYRRPTRIAALWHWRDGLAKGAVYGSVFLLIVHLPALVASLDSFRFALAQAPFLLAVGAGAVLFPAARTIVETFDGSPAFWRRLLLAARDPWGYVRGAAIGLAFALALSAELPRADSWLRFSFGLLAGAAAYAGVDLLRDGFAIAGGRRRRLQTWRLYALGALLGGAAGGVLAWYLDAWQLATVLDKWARYASVYYPSDGRAIESYVVYPLFSKWGAQDLGPTPGGVALFYAESLSGVINWSLAAPLFSINLLVLTAIVERRLRPLEELFSSRGVIALVEQAIRVLRWGLWMAPIIYSFLRLAPDPTWYNQDGLVRTIVATVQYLRLEPEDFRSWSLELFLGLLAYDWLRILIWFDHMGLRVATLVNLSFVGGDVIDEKAARFLGHSARTRCIPEGVRRFATWLPLLVPFYLPRGAEWDAVWSGAEQLRGAAAPLLPAVGTALVGYAFASGLCCLVLAILYNELARARRIRQPRPRTQPGVGWAPDRPWLLSNGRYTVELAADGRGFSRVLSELHREFELDLTRRPDDPLRRRGKLFWLRDRDLPEALPIGLQALPGTADPSFPEMERLRPWQARLRRSCQGLRFQATVSVAASDPVELWDVEVENREDRPRRLRLTSYQEFALAPRDAYERAPAYAALHVATWFLPCLGAVLARNRMLPGGARRPEADRPWPEVAFHAVGIGSDGSVRLAGYEDSRSRFLGAGGIARPDGLALGAPRPVEDAGRLYTFDPAASLALDIDLPPRGRVRIRFVDGYARDRDRAVALIARYTGNPLPDPARLEAETRAIRGLRDPVLPAGLRAGFAADGRAVVLPGGLPRPWHHLLASPLGHGVVASSDGELFAFGTNAQQNAWNRFQLDTVPVDWPSRGLFVLDRDTGALETATFAPARRPDADYEVSFEPGAVRYLKRPRDPVRDGLELELEVLVVDDSPVQVDLLRLCNRGKEPRRLRIVPAVHVALAELPRDSRGHLETRVEETGPFAVYLRHDRNDFAKGWLFVATSLQVDAVESWRTRAMGMPEHWARRPILLAAGLPDPRCRDDGERLVAFAGDLELAPGEEAEVCLALGQAPRFAEARALARRFREPATARKAREETLARWRERLSVLRVETRDPAFDRLVNDWLPYQLLAARLWGRCGPQQRGGAFGFRDQLQDVLPLLFLDPELARAQILLHAAQQFLEGDALQWWHLSWEGKTGLGARNRASDPHLWLPYVVVRYVAATGDDAVLDEPVPFLEGRPIPPGADGVVFAPRPSREVESLFEHCRRAIDLALSRSGPNGLPLIGTGDWNDGFDRLGHRGRGESVWLGCFLLDVLRGMSGLAASRGRDDLVRAWDEAAERLRAALRRMARGDRFVRATDDRGRELVLTDALSAAWPVLAQVVDLDEGVRLVEAALAVLEQDGMVLLLHPPFDETSDPYPGRIAAYPPGVRENGGQYSHGVSWLVDALVELAARARARGRESEAERLEARAVEVWYKISPIGESDPAKLARYGLPPHQQPADVSFGPGYEERGGWAWYTGSAARMLSAAHALLGLAMRNGELVFTRDPGRPCGTLRLERLLWRGRVLVEGGSACAPVVANSAMQPRALSSGVRDR